MVVLIKGKGAEQSIMILSNPLCQSHFGEGVEKDSSSLYLQASHSLQKEHV